MKFRLTWCRTWGTSGKFGFGCTTEPDGGENKKTKKVQSVSVNVELPGGDDDKIKPRLLSDLGPWRVYWAGSLRCPAGWSSGASCRATMETACTAASCCAPTTESLGSHLRTGPGGVRTLQGTGPQHAQWLTNNNNNNIELKKTQCRPSEASFNPLLSKTFNSFKEQLNTWIQLQNNIWIQG